MREAVYRAELELKEGQLPLAWERALAEEFTLIAIDSVLRELDELDAPEGKE